MEKTIGIILAAGKGTRLNNGNPSDIPKVLHKVGDKPLISYCIEAIKKAGIGDVIAVVGYKVDMVKKEIGDSVKYVLQENQLGTSHALYKTRSEVEGKADYLVVLNGDTPFFSPETINELVSNCKSSNAVITLATTEFSDPTGLGRIIKDENGYIKKIVEEKEATEEEKKIKEINGGLYCFDNNWLWSQIDNVHKSPHGEYYLTDLIGMAVSEGEKVGTLKIADNRQVIGVNTPEHLVHANKLLGEMENEGI